MTATAAAIAIAPRRPYSRTFDERRERVLAEAWQLIAEREGDSFSIAELSERSGVSARTIYNAFGDRDGVVAKSVAAHYRALFPEPLNEDIEPRDLCAALAMIDEVVAEISKVPGWSRTGAMMYFAPRTSATITDSLRAMPLAILNAWLASPEADAGRLAVVRRDELERSYANGQWGLTNDWAAGRITEAELARNMKLGLIIVVLALGTPGAQVEASRIAATLR